MSMAFGRLEGRLESADTGEADSGVPETSSEQEGGAVHGYHVRESDQPLLKKIFATYGPFDANCVVSSPYIKQSCIESLLKVVTLLKTKTARTLTCEEAKFIVEAVGDLVVLEFDVGWLRAEVARLDAMTNFVVSSDAILHFSNNIEATEKLLGELKEKREAAEEENRAALALLPPNFDPDSVFCPNF